MLHPKFIDRIPFCMNCFHAFLVFTIVLSANIINVSAQHRYKKLDLDSLIFGIEAIDNNDYELLIEKKKELAFQYQLRGDLPKILETFDRIAELAKSKFDDSTYFHALDNVAATYYRINDEQRCDSICQIIRNSENAPAIVMGSAYYFSAYFLDSRAEYNEAKVNHITALKYYKEANDSIKIPLVLRHLGTISNRQGMPAESLSYYQEAIDYYRPGSRTHYLVINIYNSINNIFYKHKNYNQALEYSTKILDLLHLVRSEDSQQFYKLLHAKNLEALQLHTEADSMYNDAHRYYTSISASPFKLLALVGLLGNSLNHDDLDQAETLIDSLEYNFSDVAPDEKIHSLVGLKLDYAKFKLKLNLKRKDFLELKKELDDIENTLLTNEDLQLRFLFHDYSYKYYNRIGQYKMALSNFEKAEILGDSIYRMDQMVLLQDIESRYQKAEQDNKINLLSSENELAQLKLESSSKRSLILGSALILFTVLSLFLLSLYRKIKKKNAIIQEADNEKSILLQEIHHRVKNNLQVISSLLALQGKYVKDDHALDALKQGQDRVQSMALIHQDLYQSDNLKGVNAQDYFEQVVDNLFDSYNISEEDIELELDVTPIMLDVDTMIPLGLVINELVSNSLKHAFSNKNNGVIKVKLKEESGVLNLEVSDNGVGINSLDEIEGKSFGYELVKAFAKKLKADITIEHDNGFSMKLNIKNYKLAA